LSIFGFHQQRHFFEWVLSFDNNGAVSRIIMRRRNAINEIYNKKNLESIELRID